MESGMCASAQDHITWLKLKKERKKEREGKDVQVCLPRHPNGPQASVSRGRGSQMWFSYQHRLLFEPEGVERRTKGGVHACTVNAGGGGRH